MERSPRPRRRSLRTLLAPATDNWFSRGYLALVAASVGFFLYAAYLSPDPGFAAVYPLITTAPFSFLALLVTTPLQAVEWLSPAVFSAAAAAAGLVNATVLGLLVRRVRVPQPHAAA
ncbi:SCO4225 family membrane protein [Streptomyces sp. NPDC057798]|uniref:SCO4225 family membrane protein n=1 Tax=Streptomyces sp. NPDC057798 TaxID=3346252 RepID=UPI0036B1C1E5